MDFDAETLRIEGQQVRSTQWYDELLQYIRGQQSYYANRFLKCENMNEVCSLQGAIRALNDIEAKITRED